MDIGCVAGFGHCRWSHMKSLPIKDILYDGRLSNEDTVYDSTSYIEMVMRW